MELALFSYRRGNSLLHKTPAAIKIIFLFAFSLFVFWGTVPDTAKEIFCKPMVVRTAICLFVSFALFFMAGARWKSLLALRFVFVLGIMVALVKMFSFSAEERLDGLAGGALYTARFFATALAAQCVFETTSMAQIQSALHLPLPITLALNFIPMIFSEWKKIKLAARARLGTKKIGFAKSAVLILYETQALLFVMLNKAESVRKAVANRA